MAKKPSAEPAGELAIDVAAPTKSKKKLFIIIGLSLVLLGALGAGGYYFYMGMGKKAHFGGDNATAQKPESKPAAGHDEAAKDAKAGDHAASSLAGGGGGGELVSIPPFLVNLADPQGRRYLKLALDVELRDKAASDELNKNMPKIKDALILLLSSKTYEDLASIENKILLKKDIVERLTLILGEQKVLRVYITEIVIQ